MSRHTRTAIRWIAPAMFALSLTAFHLSATGHVLTAAETWTACSPHDAVNSKGGTWDFSCSHTPYACETDPWWYRSFVCDQTQGCHGGLQKDYGVSCTAPSYLQGYSYSGSAIAGCGSIGYTDSGYKHPVTVVSPSTTLVCKPCEAKGTAVTRPFQCCSGAWSGSTCSCGANSTVCYSNSDCCSNNCLEGTCAGAGKT